MANMKISELPSLSSLPDDAVVPVVSGGKVYQVLAGSLSGIQRTVANDDSIVPSGSYIGSIYYNSSYGVKVGYMANGDVLLSMQSGTSNTYEYLEFSLNTAISGVSITTVVPSGSYTGGQPGLIYACVLHGITNTVNISVQMRNINYSKNSVTAQITVTEVSA